MKNWSACHQIHDSLIEVYLSPFHGFYETHDSAVHLPAGGSPESASHLLAILADTEILLAHIIAVMNVKIIQEQKMVFLVFPETIEKGFLLRPGNLPFC